MIEQQDSNLHFPEVNRRIAAFSTMAFDQVDRNLEGVLSYIQALVHAGVVHQSFKEEMSQKANKAATARKEYIDSLELALIGLGFQLVGLMGAGAAILAGLLDHHVRSNNFLGLNLLWFAVPLLVGHGMVFLGSGYRQGFASVLRNKMSWCVIAALIGVMTYDLTTTYLAMPKTLS
jgi:hypothetical protein